MNLNERNWKKKKGILNFRFFSSEKENFFCVVGEFSSINNIMNIF